VKDKEIDMDAFFTDFGIAESTRYSFFSGMRSGQRGITFDQVRIAWEKYGVRPDYLFGVVNQAENVLAEPPAHYAKSISTDIKKIRKLLDDLEKKIENK
jgi:hypothetical protein